VKILFQEPAANHDSNWLASGYQDWTGAREDDASGFKMGIPANNAETP